MAVQERSGKHWTYPDSQVKNVFVLNSTEHEIFSANKYENVDDSF